MDLLKPYYAVIFTNTRTAEDNGYGAMAQQMEKLARQQPGFLDFESARSSIGISISYWETKEAIVSWKENVDHQLAQQKGIKDWYSWYKVRICSVEREYTFGTKS